MIEREAPGAVTQQARLTRSWTCSAVLIATRTRLAFSIAYSRLGGGFLKDQLHPELDLPRVDLRARDASEVDLRDVGDRSAEHHTVQWVQDLHPELVRETFPDPGILHQRKRLVQTRGPADFQVTRRGPQGSICRQRKGAAVQIEVRRRVEVRH